LPKPVRAIGAIAPSGSYTWCSREFPRTEMAIDPDYQ
jgi:hypothetical protein